MPKKHLEEQPDVEIREENTRSESKGGSIKDTMIKFPQMPNSKTKAKETEDLISELTGKPNKGPFAGSIQIPLKPFAGEISETHRHRIADTRSRISGLISGRTGNISSNKPSAKPSQSGRNRAPFPLNKILPKDK